MFGADTVQIPARRDSIRFRLGEYPGRNSPGAPGFRDRFLGGQRNGPLAAPFQTESFFKNRRTWVGPRFSPVNSPMRAHASFTVCGPGAPGLTKRFFQCLMIRFKLTDRFAPMQLTQSIYAAATIPRDDAVARGGRHASHSPGLAMTNALRDQPKNLSRRAGTAGHVGVPMDRDL